MAENDIAIQVGVVLDADDIGKQLAAIGNNKDNKIKVTADTDEAKKKINELKDDLKNSKSPAKIAIDVLKGQSNTNIGNYIKEIQNKYQASPIKITLDIDKNATTANINKAVGEMQQQVQKAVDQVAKVNNVNTNIVTPGAGVQIIDNNQLRESIKNLEEAEGLAKRITNYSWTQTEDGISSLQATSQIERYNEALGKTVTVYKEIDKEQSELAGWDIFKETGQSIQENFERVEKLEQQTMNYFSKLQTEYNKMQSSISGQGNPLIGDYAQKATEALEKYRDEYTKVMNAGNGATDTQKRNIEELRQQTLLVIKEQRSLQKAYEDTLITVQKQQNVLETTYAKAFDKNATKTLFFEDGDATNKKFAEPVIEQYEKIKTLLFDIENNARNNGLAITTEQTNQLTEAFAKLNIVISEQKNARWTATNFKETDTASFVERYKNMMVELSNALKDDGVYDKFQTKISQLFTTLNSVKSGDASTGDFLNQLRNIKQEINTFESSVKGRGIMAAFDISEDQLVRIKSLGKALSGQENTQGIENLKQKLTDLGKAYEELQAKMQAKGISRDRLNNLEAEQKALDKELQSINSMVNNLGNESWVKSQNAGIADMKAKFAEYREEIAKTVQLTPELDQRLKDLAQAMSESGKVDATNWKDYSNAIKTLKANIDEFKGTLEGKASQLSLGIETNQLQQIEDIINKFNSLDEQYSGAGAERIRNDFQSLSEEYQKVIDQLQSKDLTDSQFKELSKQVEDLDQRFKQLSKEAAVFGNQDSFGKFTASTNTLKLNLEKLEKQYASLIAKNPELAGKVEDLKQRLESLRPGEIPTITKDISNLGKEMANASGQTAGLRGALTDAFGGLGSYLARFTSSYYIITKTIQGIKKMVDAVKEVDTSLVELQKVTNLTGDSLTQFTDKAYQMGAQLGRTGKDVIDATTTFSRAGYDLREATELAQSALVMTNVGVDIPNIESAASDMISILKAFDVQAEESMDVIDKLYNVANKEPLDFGNITQMLVTAGGTLAQSGTSLEETMGLLTGAFATLRNSSVANGLLMISQRLRGLSEDGEAIDGLIPKLQTLFSSVGINIEDQNGELRSTFDILQDLAAVWDQLSSKQKQYFGEKVAGNRQVKTLNAIMQNWDVVADTIDKANNAQGEALKGNEMYMDSIQGRMTQLQSAFQELAKTTINSDFVKNIVSLGTSAVKLISDLGGLPPILTTILGVVLAIKGADIVSGITKIGSALAGLFSSFSLAAGLPGILIAIAGAIALVVNHINNANSSLAQFEKAKESYEEHKTKVESLNNELKTTQDRIAELEGKDSLTIVEQTELDRLKDVNQELRDQIELEKALQNIALSEERRNAANYLETKMVSPAGEYNKKATKYLPLDYLKDNTSNVDHSKMRNYGNVTDADQLMPNFEEKIKVDMAALDAMLEKYTDIQGEIRRVSEQGGDTSLLTQEKNQLKEDMDSIESELRGFYNTINEKTKDFNLVEDAVPGSVEDRMNKLIQFRQEIENVFKEIESRSKATTLEGINKEIDDVLSKYPEAVKKVQEQIKESSDGWELDIPEDLAQELMSKFDLTLEEVKQLFLEKYGPGSGNLQLTIGPQMAVEADDVVSKLFQNTDGYTKVLTKALSEQEKAGELTASTISKLLSSDSGLPGIAECLEKTANGYRLNTDRVNEYVNAQNADIRLDALAGIMERQYALEDLALKYGDVAMAEWAEVDAQNGLIDAQNAATWQNEIIELQAVADEAWDAADALDALREASKTPNEDADHTEAQKLLDKTKEMWEVGKVGTDDFKAGMDYLLGDDWLTRYEGNLEKAFNAFEAKRKKFFAEDDADSAENFMNALVDKKLATRNKKTGDIDLLTDDINEVATALGISETAAQDLFDLLNSYSFSGKFEFGKDAITSAEELEVAQNKLNKLNEEKIQKQKELEAAQKELDEAYGTNKEEEKAEKVKKLTEEYNSLEEQANNLESAITTANETLQKEFEPPKTLEEALQQITDLQTAIDTLTAEKITVPVELPQELNKLIEYISNPSNVLTVDAKEGQIDDKVNEIIAFRDAINANPNIPAEVKATVTGITKQVIGDLKNFNSEVEEIDGRKGVLAKVTVGTSGGSQATVVLQKVEDKAEELDKSDPTVSVKAELPSPDELKVIYSVNANQDELRQADADIQAVADKERTATIKTIFSDGTEDGDGVVNPNTLNKDQWKQYQDDVGDRNAIPLLLPDDPIVKPKIDRTAFGQDFLDALNEAERKSEAVEVKTEPDSKSLQNSLKESVDETLKLPVETEQSPEEVASEFKQEWGEFWTGEKIPIGGITINQEEAEQDAEKAVEQIPEQEISAGINESQLTEQVENAVSEANPPDVVVGVKQEVKGGVAKPKDVNQTVNVKGKDAGGVKAVQDVQNQAEKGATVPIDADTSEAKKEDDSLISKIRQKVTKLVGLDVGTILKDIGELEKRLSQKVQKIVEVTYKETNPRPYAKGTKRAEEGLSLVDEQGAELIEHRKRGTYELGSNDGARLTHLDRGDIVHTADETKKMLGKLGSVGTLVKNGLGTLRAVIGNAFASGTRVTEVGRVRVQPKKKKEEEKKTKSISSRGTSSRGSSSSSSSSSSSGNSDLSTWTNWTKQFFDWAEIKLNKLKEATTGFIDAAAKAIGAVAKNAQLDKAMESIKEEIKANEDAFLEYYDTASRIAAGLSEDIIQKIHNGTIDVASYDDLTQQKIKDYQTWYEKAMACSKAIDKLIEQQKELAKQRLQNIVDDYSAEAKKYETQAGTEAARRDYEATTGKATRGAPVEEKSYEDFEIDFDENGKATVRTTGKGTKQGFGYGYGDYGDQIEYETKKLRTLTAEREKLQAELDSLVASGEVEVGDSTYVQYTEQISNLGKEAYQTAAGIERLKDEAKEAGMKPIVDEREALDYDAERTKQQMDLGNAEGSLSMEGKASTYKSLIENTEEQNKNLRIQNELYKEQQKGLDVNSQKYQDLEQKIRVNESAITANEQAAVGYRQEMNNLKLEELADGFNDITNAASALNATLNKNLATGVKLTTKLYDQLIQKGKELIENLKGQRQYWQDLMDNLVAEHGEEAKTSDLYRSYQQQAASVDRQIEDAEMQNIQLEQDKKNIKATKLGWALDKYKNNAAKYEDDIAYKEETGQEVTAHDYKRLIANAQNQNKAMEDQNEEYRKQQEGMDEASEAYQQLEQKIRANDEAIRTNNQNIAKWEEKIENLPIEKLANDLDRLKTKADELNDSLSSKKAKGEEITSEDYQSLIDNAAEQTEVLQAENDAYREQQQGMDENSTEYQELQKKIEDNESAMRDLDASTTQWEKNIAELPAQKLGNDLDRLKTKADELNDSLNFKIAKGEEITAKDYQDLIDNAAEQKETYSAQNEEYKAQQEEMDENSEAYQELQKKIEANENAMRDLDAATLQWNKDISNLSVEKLGWELDDLQTEADKLNDSLNMKKLTGQAITAQDYQKLIDNAKEQRSVYEQQNEELSKQLIGLDKNSEEYQRIKKEIDANNSSMRELDEATVQWGKDIKQIRIDDIKFEIDSRKHNTSMLESNIELKNAKGQYVWEWDYQDLIANTNDQIASNEELILALLGLQSTTEKNSEDYRNYQKEIDGLRESNVDLELSALAATKTMKNLSIDYLGYNIDRYKAEAQENEDNIGYKRVIGKTIDFSDYSKEIGNLETTNALLSVQIDEWKKNQEGLSFYSPDYQEYQNNIYKAEQEIRNNKTKIEELYSKREEIELENLDWEIKALEAETERVQSLMDLNKAQGYDESVSSYKELIDLGTKRIEILEKENDTLRWQKIYMDETSEAYQNIQRQIEGNEKEISSIKKSQEEWNDSIVDVGINNLKKYKDSMSKINDQLQKQKDMQDAIQEMQKAQSQRKVRTYIEGKGFVYQASEEDLKNAQENLENVVRNQLLGKIDDLIDALEESKKDTNVYDKNGNLIGAVYNTPQLGNLSSILETYYKNNANPTLDIKSLTEALGKNIIPNQTTSTSFSIGDIVINDVQNGNDLAKAIIDQFPNALLQALYKK